MIDSKTQPLKILNASAGSGKTYNLVITYLSLILGEGRNPSAFSNIMAMTFTNKAAFEMKHRIISALDTLANPNRETTKESLKAKKYSEDVAKEINCSTAELQRRAKVALKQILHQYEDFHVMTIDKFNLRLIRSFSLDLGLDGDFQIILNEDEVLEKVIDTLMDSLDPINKVKFTNLVLKYANEKVNDEEKWNFQKDLKSFAGILTQEKYFPLLEDLDQMDYSEASYDIMNLEINRIKAEIESNAQKLHAIASNFSPNDLPGKSTTMNAYAKLVGDKLMEGSGSDGHFFSEAMLGKFEKSDFPEALASASIEFDQLYANLSVKYHLWMHIKRNFFNLALLQFIAQELETVKGKENLLRISEFNKLISKHIENEDAPFIYERLGNRFQHFLLDEFQDTSRLQWMNIVPLIHESISQDKENLIVGDPKQSIYRFKNGLAEQFVALPAIYNPEHDAKIAEKSNLFKQLGIKLPLQDNWRSNQEIVRFNNALFTTFRHQLPENYASFYEDVVQNPKGDQGGYISIHSQKISDQAEDNSIPMLISWINQCIADGIDKGDICILGDRKKDCNRWAIELTSLGHKVVSADSLLVDSDLHVKLTIAYLKWRKNPAGELEARRFSEMYFSSKSNNSIASIKSFWKTTTNADGKQFQFFDTTKFFSEHFESEDAFFFPYENLYNLLQGFYKMARLEEIHNPYLHHLSDMAHEFDNLYGPELERFLDNYQSKGKNSSIQIPENKDAIKIMTGHKSKGLEFPIVMLPTMNWDLGTTKSTLLFKSDENLIFAHYSNKSKIKRIKEEQELESNQILIDKLNLCYVMFTRPVERLYVANFFKEKTRFGAKLHQVLQQMSLNELDVSKQRIEDELIELEIGKTIVRSSEEIEENALKEENETNFIPVSLQNRLWFPDISLQENALDEAHGLSDQQRYGNQLHLLLSVVENSDEIAEKIRSLHLEGLIETAFLEKLTAQMEQIFALEAYQELLNDNSEILNEQGIIIRENETKRPDKIIVKPNETIVIDYKTGIPNAKHLVQVQLYADTLAEMGYPNVRGIVFYTSELRLVRAESV